MTNIHTLSEEYQKRLSYTVPFGKMDNHLESHLAVDSDNTANANEDIPVTTNR